VNQWNSFSWSSNCILCLGLFPQNNPLPPALRGLVGYDFGPVDLQLWVTDSFVGNNAPQGPNGINVWSRIGFKIWGPEAPKPLVAKN
jgi:hypothetical protein